MSAAEKDLTRRHLVETGDGSHSLYVPDLDEQYHSRHGAVQESLHVFLKMGLEPRTENSREELEPKTNESLRILEIGFGTGLNAWLTALHSQEIQIEYTGIEAYPLTQEEASTLNYVEQYSQTLKEGTHSPVSEKDLPKAAALFTWLHETPWDAPSTHSDFPSFAVTKKHARIEHFDLEYQVHLVYFDAFAPEKQPELWTDTVFEKMFRLLAPGGTLVTYSAKGAVRRTMLAAGFEVEKVPGPPGKREMLRAKKPF